MWPLEHWNRNRLWLERTAFPTPVLPTRGPPGDADDDRKGPDIHIWERLISQGKTTGGILAWKGHNGVWNQHGPCNNLCTLFPIYDSWHKELSPFWNNMPCLMIAKSVLVGTQQSIFHDDVGTDMDMFSTFMAFCEGDPPADFSHKETVMQSFGVF